MFSFRSVLRKSALFNPKYSMLTRSKTRSYSNHTNYTVKHNQNAKEFYINLNSDTAVLKYEKFPDVIDFYETLVPEKYQGKGIGKLLAKEAFEYAIKDNKKIQLTCTYLQKYYCENYEKYKNYVLDDDLECNN